MEGGVSEFWSGLRVLLSASCLCGRLDGLVFGSDVVVLLGSVRSLDWRPAPDLGGEDKDCLGFKVSKEGGEVE